MGKERIHISEMSDPVKKNLKQSSKSMCSKFMNLHLKAECIMVANLGITWVRLWNYFSSEWLWAIISPL